MSDPRTAPYAAVRLVDVTRLANIDPGNEDVTDGAFHLVRRHFDVQAFGVNGITGNTGDVMIIEHDERDDTDSGTEGHEELFAVMSGHAVFMVAGDEIEAPAGTLVFVRDRHYGNSRAGCATDRSAIERTSSTESSRHRVRSPGCIAARISASVSFGSLRRPSPAS
jgi:mannose-6-phosphate isomerase-like protein (cupin superfamily)